MEELGVREIMNGVVHPDYAEHRSVLLQALANKCADEQLLSTEKNNIADIFKFCVILLCKGDQDAECTNLICLTLTNLTVSDGMLEEFFNLMDSKEEFEKKLMSCVRRFFNHNPQAEANDDFGADSIADPGQHIGSFLCNISRVDQGRRFLLKKSNDFIPRLIVQVSSHNPIRKKGVIGSLRNCLFDKDVHWSMMFDMNILTPLLLPLIVNTPFTEKEMDGMDPILWMHAEVVDTDKEKIDKEVTKLLLECIILLCQTKLIRQELRKRKVYPICRNMDYLLEDDSINDTVFEIVNFLEREDDPYEDDGSESMQKRTNLIENGNDDSNESSKK